MRFVNINGIYIKCLLVLVLLASSSLLISHDVIKWDGNKHPQRKIEFPDIKGYKTLVVDLHTHSSFSDGHVWPKIRVEESLRDGLDAIAITEHLEWQPHRRDLPHPDRNRAYQIALESLPENESLMIIAGTEITRRAPYGYMNAVFIQDANQLLKHADSFEGDDSVPEAFLDHVSQWPAAEALKAANSQGAFVFWNHPFWTRHQPDGLAKVGEFQAEQIALGHIQGIEIANGHDFSEEAFQIALDHKLTVLGVSDIHDLIDWDFDVSNGGHRPVTLVFAKKKSPESLKQALMQGRTVAWFKNVLAGKEENMNALLDASIELLSASYVENSDLLEITFRNHSDANFQLKNINKSTFANNAEILEIPAHQQASFKYKPGSRLPKVDLEFEVLNAYIAPRTNAKRQYSVKAKID